MVTKTKSKRQQSIKSKLIAAVCMLLVSTIMMVSSTYAWFTLSTAPEVTGITTSVGANGNLEMALLPDTGDTADITSSAGDSILDWSEKNITWGNLVNLSDASIYGLDDIMLYPAALNAATADESGRPLTIATALLKTPAYGADGRVSELAANTVTSTYDSTKQNFPTNEKSGVRAVGVASGMTDRQLAYRNARSAANTAMAQAKTSASVSLSNNGDALANTALKKATSDAPTFTQTDVAALTSIVDDLLGTADTTNGSGETVKGKTGVLKYIEDAYLQYIIAYGASQDSVTAGMDDTEFKAFQATMEGATDLYDAVSKLEAHGVRLPGTVSSVITSLQTTRSNVASAKNDLATMAAKGEDATFGWANANGETGISTPLYKLCNTDAMLIAGIRADQVMQNTSAVMNSVAAGGLTVTIATGGGVYADIADHCGDFNASITIAEISYGGLSLKNMNARMTTATSVNPVHLSTFSTSVQEAQSPASAAGTVQPITDMYGYVIDLAFRTNAAESNLLLQTEAKSRIYGEEGSEDTMGHGATMTFKATTADFSDSQVLELMNSIRVVFYDPGTMGVLATAKLDTQSTTPDGNGGITAPIKLYSGVITEATTTVTYLPVASTATYDNKVTYYTQKSAATVKYNESADAAVDYVAGKQLYTAPAAEGGAYTAVTTFDTAKTYYTRSGNEGNYTYTEVAADALATTVSNGDTLYISDGAETPTYTAVNIAIASGTTYYTAETVAAVYEAWAPSNPDKEDATEFSEAISGLYTKNEATSSANVNYLVDKEAVITALTQNTAQKVSVLVYLDGATITNADVAATATSSVKGSMNLQFASSANLVPMEYAALMDPTKTDSDSSTGVDVTDYTAFTSAITVNGAGNENIQAQGGFKGTAGYVTLTGVPAGKTATVTGVKVGEQDAPANSIKANTFDGKAGFAFTVPVAPAATDAVVVTITVADATYKVTLPEGDGYTVAAASGFDANSVTHNGSFAFKVTVETGYEIKEVKAGDQTLTANADGVYTISNITANVSVTVTAEATAAPEGGTDGN